MAQGLRALRDPSDGRPVVRRLLAPDQAFPGPLADAAPMDLLVELDPRYVAEFHKRRRAVFRPGSFDQHAPDGIYLLVGPGIPAGPAADGSLFDVAPTALAFFGVAPPADLTGSPLVDFPTAPQRAATSGPAALEIEPAAPPSQDEAEALGRKLRALGYLE
jgi:predicted AlkP superfamily phosphohydrolase/phosphomutase